MKRRIASKKTASAASGVGQEVITRLGGAIAGAGGDIDVSLSQPGTYYIAFNNKFSLFSDKTISSNITIQH